MASIYKRREGKQEPYSIQYKDHGASEGLSKDSRTRG